MANWNINGADFISKYAAELQFDAVVEFEDEMIRLATAVIQETPLGIDKPGKLKNNWQIARKPNDRILKSANLRKGGAYVEKKIRGKLGTVNKNGIKAITNKSLYLFNNSKYARVVEFGGYPTPVKKGTYNKRTKSYEIRSARGYSKQAPVGMLRINIIRSKNRIKRKMKRLR